MPDRRPIPRHALDHRPTTRPGIGSVVLGLCLAALAVAGLCLPGHSPARTTPTGHGAAHLSAVQQRRCPAYPAFPTGRCTGVPLGQHLTVVTGDRTYGPSFNGRTISNKDFHGWVTVTGANITFTNCFFRGRAANGANHALLDTESSSGTITVTDSEFAPSHPAATIDGLWARNTKIYRANIHGTVDGMKAETNTLVQASWIHNMSYFSSDPNQGGGPTHNDGVQSYPPGQVNVTLRHNRIDLSGTTDANAAFMSAAYGSRVENNYLDGGGCTLNFDAKSLGGRTLKPIYVDGNHFGRHQGFTGCVALISNKTIMTQYNSNVWQNTGQSVPRWQQHD